MIAAMSLLIAGGTKGHVGADPDFRDAGRRAEEEEDEEEQRADGFLAF